MPTSLVVSMEDILVALDNSGKPIWSKSGEGIEMAIRQSEDSTRCFYRRKNQLCYVSEPTWAEKRVSADFFDGLEGDETHLDTVSSARSRSSPILTYDSSFEHIACCYLDEKGCVYLTSWNIKANTVNYRLPISNIFTDVKGLGLSGSYVVIGGNHHGSGRILLVDQLGQPAVVKDLQGRLVAFRNLDEHCIVVNPNSVTIFGLHPPKATFDELITVMVTSPIDAALVDRSAYILTSSDLTRITIP